MAASQENRMGTTSLSQTSNASGRIVPPVTPDPPMLPTSRRALLERGLAASTVIGAAWLANTGMTRLREQARETVGSALPRFAPLPRDADRVRVVRHVLNRTAWGATPGDIAHVAAIGPGAWLEEQLADHLEENPAVGWRVSGLDVQQAQQDAPDELYSLADEQLLRETQAAMLLRAVYSRRQLHEILADFWTNHFNIYALKKDGQTLIPADTESVLRPHALGTFRDLLLGSAHSPAMLQYLDNQENQRGVPNENYARELLELHTLGVKSGYTQRDIQEVARAFTGWTVQTGFRRGQYTFDETRHDNGAKFVPFLNLTLTPNRGEKDAETVLLQLAEHPTTARFLARKLCRRFLGTTPPAVIEAAANAYLKSKTDIRATLRPILLDALQNPEYNAPIFKRPLDYVISALRILGADTDGGTALQKQLADMGQPLYQWPMPDGFPERAEAWTSGLLPRWNFASALTTNSLAGTTIDLSALLNAVHAKKEEKQIDALIETVCACPADAPEMKTTRAVLTQHFAKAASAKVAPRALIAEGASLLLASPAFQWR